MVIPGPVSYPEGDELRGSMSRLMQTLSAIENLSTGPWSETNPSASQIYRAEMQPTVRKLLDIIRGAEPLAPYVGGQRAAELKSRFDLAVDAAEAYRDDPTVSRMQAMSSSAIDAVKNAFDLVMLGQAITTAQEQSARITSEGRQSLDTLASNVRAEIDAAIARLHTEAERITEMISARGEETVARTRKAVASIQLTDAQNQFAAAQPWFNWQVTAWAVLSTCSIAAFIWKTQTFLLDQKLPEKWTWQLAFYGGMRLVLLGGIAAVASFCLRMLKSQIGLAQLNAHRTRIAHSMPGLIEIAAESERLPVLQSLIGSIIGVKESVLADAHPETFLATAEVIERVIKAAKPGE